VMGTPHVFTVLHVYVPSDRRNRGIGIVLLQTMVKHCRCAECTQIDVHEWFWDATAVVTGVNVKAIHHSMRILKGSISQFMSILCICLNNVCNRSHVIFTDIQRNIAIPHHYLFHERQLHESFSDPDKTHSHTFDKNG
jgi:hypothetical protein